MELVRVVLATSLLVIESGRLTISCSLTILLAKVKWKYGRDGVELESSNSVSLKIEAKSTWESKEEADSVVTSSRRRMELPLALKSYCAYWVYHLERATDLIGIVFSVKVVVLIGSFFLKGPDHSIGEESRSDPYLDESTSRVGRCSHLRKKRLPHQKEERHLNQPQPHYQFAWNQTKPRSERL